MKKYFLISFILVSAACLSQQTIQYTEYMLNDMGFNPAAAGDNNEYEILAGKRLQWLGFANAPVTNFGSVTRGFFKRPYHNYWHGIGLYFEEDKAGPITTKTAYPIYAFHFTTNKKRNITIGISPGIRFYGSSVVDKFDPILVAYPLRKTFFPDINLGVRYHTRKLQIDLSVKQIGKNKVDATVASVQLTPHGYLSISSKFYSKEYDYIFEPSVQLRSNFLSLPSFSTSFMMFIGKHIGFGLAYRWNDAVSGIVQFHLAKSIILGLAYDYTVSKLRFSGANSLEMMAGMSPSNFIEGLDDDRHGGASCPVWDF